jgi:hypothetical protein
LDTQLRAKLGRLLCEFRHRAGLTQEQLGVAVHTSRSNLAGIESGRQGSPREFWQAADEALSAGGVLLDRAVCCWTPTTATCGWPTSSRPASWSACCPGPPVWRALFGDGPVTVAVPLRAMPGRALPVISSEDARAAEEMTRVLSDLSVKVRHGRIPVGGGWRPAGSTVAICGPKSPAAIKDLIDTDPFLGFATDDVGVWRIRDKASGQLYTSAMDVSATALEDVAYVGRLRAGAATVLVVASVHALGSMGAVHYLARNLQTIFDTVGTGRFSMVVASTHDAETVLASDRIGELRVHG